MELNGNKTKSEEGKERDKKKKADLEAKISNLKDQISDYAKMESREVVLPEEPTKNKDEIETQASSDVLSEILPTKKPPKIPEESKETSKIENTLIVKKEPMKTAFLEYLDHFNIPYKNVKFYPFKTMQHSFKLVIDGDYYKGSLGDGVALIKLGGIEWSWEKFPLHYLKILQEEELGGNQERRNRINAKIEKEKKYLKKAIDSVESRKGTSNWDEMDDVKLEKLRFELEDLEMMGKEGEK